MVLFISFVNGTAIKSSIHNLAFMSPELDPYNDVYMKTITHMSIKELLDLPKLSDYEFFDQLERGYDPIPSKNW